MERNTPEIGGFTAVDQTADPNALVRFLGAVSGSEVARRYKQQTFALVAPQESDYVLDVGCGLGDDVQALARYVGSAGKVVGVDSSQAMIDAAQGKQDPSLPVEYRVGDAYALDFPDNTFHRCRADRVFHHLDTPVQALAEMVRVARPGARIVVSEPDWGTTIVDSADPALTHKIMALRANLVRNPLIARQLPRLFRRAGLTNVAVVPYLGSTTNLELAHQAWGLRTAVDAAVTSGLLTGE
jgi:ubiquinone/menaquinone biosynthesis C-methylase UbiE